MAKHPPDLVFLDVQMPELSGLELLRQLPPATLVVFTTAFSEYAVEGFNLKAVDYLLKPFSQERFEQAAERARQQFILQKQMAETYEDCLFVKADNGVVKIFPEQILYLENAANYVKIFLASGRYVLVRASLKELEEKLRPKGFLRIHRSYIVPLAKITALQGRTLYLNTVALPIGSNFAPSVQQLFKSRLR